MKTASLGLFEVMVVRVNAGGDAPPDPPSVGDVMGPFPFLCFLQYIFWRMSGERDNIFGELLRITRNHIKPYGGPSVGDVTGCHGPFPLSLFSYRKFFGELAGKYI